MFYDILEHCAAKVLMPPTFDLLEELLVNFLNPFNRDLMDDSREVDRL